MWWVEIAPETLELEDKFPFGKASLYRCELLVLSEYFLMISQAWEELCIESTCMVFGVFLVLGSFLLSHQGGGNFPNFLQMVLRWQPTGGQRKLTSTNQSIPGCPIKLHGPQIKAGKVVVFFGTWNFIKFHGPQKTISDFEAPLGTLVMCL